MKTYLTLCTLNFALDEAPVLLTRKLPSSVLARLEASCDVERFDGDATMPHEALVERLAGKHGLISLITDSVDAAAIAAGSQLRVIANVAVGYNNIDVAAARGRGIIVTNTPDVLTDATADFTMALILAVTRRLGEGERLIRRASGPAGRSITARHGARRQATRYRRIRPHRARGCRAGSRIRDEGCSYIAKR